MSDLLADLFSRNKYDDSHFSQLYAAYLYFRPKRIFKNKAIENGVNQKVYDRLHAKGAQSLAISIYNSAVKLAEIRVVDAVPKPWFDGADQLAKIKQERTRICNEIAEELRSIMSKVLA